jgi:hypothetical protein
MNVNIVMGVLWIVLAAAGQAPPKIGCDSCPGSLLIIADVDCSVRVDGQDLGKVTAAASKLARVDIGQHLVVASAGDLAWETTITVEKPGQILVKTDFAAARDSAAVKNAAAKWEGTWVGRTGYGDNFFGDHYSYHYESYTISVRKDGACTFNIEKTFYNDYKRQDERFSDVQNRVMNRALNSNLDRSSGACKLTPEGGIDLGYSGTVTSAGSFTFRKTWVDQARVTVQLGKRQQP